jgi:hypothetical protein
MDVRDGRFRGRNEIEVAQLGRVVALGHAVVLIFEFWELTHSHQAGRSDHERWRNLDVSVFDSVEVEEKLDQRPFQPGATVRVEQETAAGKLGGPREIDQPQTLAQFHMRARLKAAF